MNFDLYFFFLVVHRRFHCLQCHYGPEPKARKLGCLLLGVQVYYGIAWTALKIFFITARYLSRFGYLNKRRLVYLWYSCVGALTQQVIANISAWKTVEWLPRGINICTFNKGLKLPAPRALISFLSIFIWGTLYQSVFQSRISSSVSFSKSSLDIVAWPVTMSRDTQGAVQLA